MLKWVVSPLCKIFAALDPLETNVIWFLLVMLSLWLERMSTRFTQFSVLLELWGFNLTFSPEALGFHGLLALSAFIHNLGEI